MADSASRSSPGARSFAQSEFLGASVGAGTVGSIDTLQQPLRFTGEGDVTGINLRRFGDGLDVAWLRDPRYAGTVSGHFRVDGAGTSAATLALTGGGRLSSADLFKGTLSDADVSIAIADGTLQASYDGSIDKIDPAIPFADPQLEASLTGTAKVEATVRQLLTNPTTAIGDYDVSGTMALRSSTVRGLDLDSARVDRHAAEFGDHRCAARGQRPGARGPGQRPHRARRARRPRTSSTT